MAFLLDAILGLAEETEDVDTIAAAILQALKAAHQHALGHGSWKAA